MTAPAKKPEGRDTAADQGSALLRAVSGTDIERAARDSGGDFSKFAPAALLKQGSALVRKADETGRLRKFSDALDEVTAGLERNKPSYVKAFASNSPGPKAAYVGTVVALLLASATVMSFAVEASPQGRGLPIRIRPDGAHAAMDTGAVRTLIKIAEANRKGRFASGIQEEADGPVDPMIAEYWGSLNEVTLAAGATIALAGVFLVGAAISWMRDLAETYLSTKLRLADWMEAQAAMIQLNAGRLGEGQSKTRAAQLETAERFNRAAERIRADLAIAERQAAGKVTARRGQEAAQGAPSAVSLA